MASSIGRSRRSTAGNVLVCMFLIINGIFMSLPLVYTISNAFKPLNELFIFPPRLWVRHPTLDNFRDLFVLVARSRIPFTRYLFNTIFISVAGTAGHVIMASLAAFALSKHDFPGRQFMFNVVVLSLMFAPQVTAIPNYLIMSRLGWVDTHSAIIVPAWASSLGLYLMKQFMDQVPDSLLDAARIDGANEFRVFWQVVLPTVKPAWLTLIILSFQALWGETGGRFIYSEQLKTLPYAMSQMVSGGIARAGVGAAVGLLMMIVPITVFLVNQSNVVETMSTSGMTG